MGKYLVGYNNNLADNENFELCSPKSHQCVWTNKYTYFKNYKALKTMIQQKGMGYSFYMPKDLFFDMLFRMIKENLKGKQIKNLMRISDRYGSVNGYDVNKKYSMKNRENREY